jgi:hypothetical protein
MELLAAYVVSFGNTDEKTLSEHLRRTLPEHIVDSVRFPRRDSSYSEREGRSKGAASTG